MPSYTRQKQDEIIRKVKEQQAAQRQRQDEIISAAKAQKGAPGSMSVPAGVTLPSYRPGQYVVGLEGNPIPDFENEWWNEMLPRWMLAARNGGHSAVGGAVTLTLQIGVLIAPPAD
jgi:hypothetical protein